MMNQYYLPRAQYADTLKAGAQDIRAMAMLYALLVIHLSLYPYSDWRDLGVGALDYWTTPWIPPQQSILWGDILINVVGYIPLGILLAMGLYPRWTGLGAITVATALIASLACGLEAVQTFLPSRVPSKLDWLTNTAGGFLGAWMAHNVSRWLLETGAWQRVHRQWLEARSALGMVCLVLWLFGLLAPQAVPFVIGPWLGDMWWMAASHIGWYDDNSPLIDLLIDYEEAAALMGTSLFVLGAWSLGLAQTRPHSPRFRLLLPLIALTLLAGWLGPQTIPWMQGEPIRWLGDSDMAVRLSVMLSTLLAFMLAMSGWSTQRLARIALGCILLGWLCTALLPGYSAAVYVPGNDSITRVMGHISAASTWVATLWPALSLYVAWRLSNFSSNSGQK